MAAYEKKPTKNERGEFLVSNPLISGFLHYCHSINLNLNDSAAGSRYTFENFKDVDGKTPESIYDLIFYEADLLANDLHLGLNYGRMFNLHHIGVLGYLMMNCETFEQSLKAYERFQNTVGETIAIKHAVIGDDVNFELDLFGGEKSRRHRLESFLSAFVVSGLQLTGRPLKLKSCVTPFGVTGGYSVYESVLGCVPLKGDQVTFTIPKSYLKNLVVNPTPDLFSVFEKSLLESNLKNTSASFSQKVRKEVLKRIGKEKLEDLNTIAAALGMSDRSVQLKLEQEGLKFRDILEQCQLDFSTRFLQAGSPISEISYALGFSEPSAFQRAFKRWSGQTPAQYRESLSQAPKT